MVGVVAVDETELVIANNHLDLVEHLYCYRAGNRSSEYPRLEYPELEFWLSILCEPVP